MNIEKEIKVPINKDVAENILNNHDFTNVRATFQRTIRRDTPELKYEKMGIFIRTREEDDISVVTLKRKANVNKDVFEREEYETTISDVETLIQIFEILGLTKSWTMEKYRIQGNYKDVKLFIDELPFGIFLEIEGSEESISNTVKELSLENYGRITVTYWDLWDEYKKENNITENAEDILFAGKEIVLKKLYKK